MEMIVNDTSYIVMVDGVPHPVDKITKVCGCGTACNAPRLLEEHFADRREHHCPICDAETTRHLFLKDAWVCPTDSTHYWRNRSQLNSKRWHASTALVSQDAIAQATVLPTQVPVVPETIKQST